MDEYTFRPVEPLIKVPKIDPHQGCVGFSRRYIHLTRPFKEIEEKPKYVSFWIDDQKKVVAIKPENEANNQTLIVHTPQQKEIYKVSLPVEIRKIVTPIVCSTKNKFGFRGYFFHKGMICFSYGDEDNGQDE